MIGTVGFPQFSLEQIVSQIFSNRKITRTDRRRLMSMLLAKDFLNTEEQNCINKVFESLHQGSIRVID
ncbi:MAG TPA: hypothetical protein VK211_27170 [Kamptonema sp.]|nr:hypothetical protein [Kamptonema sp.]